ncbi:hypothetical protein [Qipengyuania gaetbuli]|uniref:hypothetical protein n=1 Tax=Qipengyuania gaetbuli TaxID=266952 RepID=UPI001CFCA05D|nr:hypothetical protein [Qipengyuania gaetbuli]
MFPTTIHRFALPLLIIAAGGFSVPASAGYVATPAIDNLPIEAEPIRLCANYTFDTRANLIACFETRFRDHVGYTAIIGETIDGSYAINAADGGQCQLYSQYVVPRPIGFRVLAKPGMYDASSYLQWNPSAASGRFIATEDGFAGSYLYSDPSCTNYTTYLSGQRALFQVNVNTAPGGANEPPEPVPHTAEDDCLLPYDWVDSQKPKTHIATKPVNQPFKPEVGDKYWRQIPTVAKLPKGIANGSYVPGSVVKVQEVTGKSCTFHRLQQIRFTSESVEWLQYLGAPSGEDAEAEKGITPKERSGATKISKPIVEYGKPYDANGKIIDEATIEEIMLEVMREQGIDMTENIQEARAQGVATETMKVKVECQRGVDGQCLTTNHHPAPRELIRDNPSCHDAIATCAWKPSPTEPATAETKPEQLTRMSNDGQSVVYNNPSIYPNTRYPAAMVAGGTAPDTTADPGSVANPGGSDVDGTPDGAEIGECLQNESCELTEGHVRSYLQSIGVDENRDQSGDGVANRIVGNTIAKGKCEHTENNSAYCGLAASIAILANRTVDQTGDFVFWTGKLRYGGMAEGETHEAKIPGAFLDAIEIILNIMLALSVMSITLRGKPW